MVRFDRIALFTTLMVLSAALLVFPRGECRAEGLSVKLIVNPSKTEVYLGSEPIALTARARGANLTFEWKLNGPGKLEGSGSSVFYTLPEKIEGESAQALISVTVREKSGQEITETSAFEILRAGKAKSAGLSRNTKIGIGVGAAAVIAGGAALALGGSSDSSSSVTGAWIFWAGGYDNINGLTLTLEQSGSSFTGSSSHDYVTSVSGTNRSGAIRMTINFSDGLVMTADGSLSSDGNTMSGTYTDAYPNQTPDSGSWNLTRK